MESISAKEYKNRFVDTFKGDKSGDNFPRQTPGVLYSTTQPTPVSNPKLLAWSEELSDELGIRKPESKEELDVLAGNRLPPTMKPYAACYAGHQFGNWAGQLGDGRAITLGEWVNADGKSWELQLKGAGPTPYSRRADGRAVLRSSLREYLMSEAMHYLGVPTTRALSLVLTGEQVLRDMFYNGNPAYEAGAIVTRVAPSFLRFGNFEMLASRKELDNLEKLAYWTIDTFYPHIGGDDKLILWFREVVEKTASLIVEWLRVGFVHGVMNTDNMSILGLTIDYGPYSFLDNYDLNFTPNTTDLPGRRYAFGNQAGIARWNLRCLAAALAPLMENTDLLIAELKAYDDVFMQKYYRMMADKLGFDSVGEEDVRFFGMLEETLDKVQPDMTIFYQLLIDFPLDLDQDAGIMEYFHDAFYEIPDGEAKEAFTKLIKVYQQRIKLSEVPREQLKEVMRKANPRFILRNYLLHQAIEELEKGSEQLFDKLQDAIKEPYSKNHDAFFVKRPSWATSKAGCSMLSCSS